MGLKNIVLGRKNQPLPDFTESTGRLPGISSSAGGAFERIATGGSISSGYRQLAKNNTLAGRDAHRCFTGETGPRAASSRLRMVSRLRKKERFMIWRSVWSDLVRYFMTGFTRASYGLFFYRDDIAASAVRFRSR
ncbi:MAG: hypothetical protein KC652_24315 [Cyanobacteria bacterium HKST-UBA01]|nr:hypothetical protein [Cyanobacteria bacterium HKST-UBA01]